MTHKEFAARWRATRRSRGLFCALLISLIFAPFGVFLWWLRGDGLSHLVDRDLQAEHAALTRNGPHGNTSTSPPVTIDHFDLSSRTIYLGFGLCALYILLVGLAFFLWLRHLFRRSGFLCPSCDRIFGAWDIRHILAGGHCCFCGERVLEEDPPRPPARAETDAHPGGMSGN